VSAAYGVRDVEKLLRLPRTTIRALVNAGFVTPLRGPRGAWQFTFQDLIVLRTAQALAEANVPARRITRSMRALKRHLPAQMPLSGLRIDAVADRIVVREGNRRWQPESGQYLLAFEGDPSQGSLSVIAKADVAPAVVEDTGQVARDWFARGEALEASDANAAIEAYARALAADAELIDARVNLGRLLHEAKRFAQAERVYREATDKGVRDALLLYNLGVLYEDMGRGTDGAAAYEQALAVDPALADAHYNLALLYEQLGRPRDALRHMTRYRRLTSRSG
jgi:tetratricopeptide (TPR) repeat protein